MTAYRLTRRLPGGALKSHPPFATRHQAAQAAAYVLADNRAATRPDAAAFAARVEDAELGTLHVHSSGYSFTITEEGQ